MASVSYTCSIEITDGTGPLYREPPPTLSVRSRLMIFCVGAMLGWAGPIAVATMFAR